MSKRKELEKLNSEMGEECECRLKINAKNPVPGAGNPDAEILFVGEAPGKAEDAQGLPFVGRSGKFLDEMLASISLDRDSVYITNVVKYRPPDNRDPKSEEVEACWPWLRAQIDLIDPKLIVPLGRHALNRFFPKAKISEAHGTLLRADVGDLGDHFYYPLYHPAVALYRGNSRELLLEDFARLPNALKDVKKMQ